MATTTNFGWETPDDTDLVKDGAAAIRTLGSAIDTSLVDLKGGTTNQVLAKNSNTDMDFKWVTDATGIQATIFDAKGDLIAASAADTAARLASSGVNGDVLTVDTGEATGLKWAAPASGSYTQLASGSLSSTSLSLQSISGSYRDLVLILRDYSFDNDTSLYLKLNNTANVYYNQRGSYENTNVAITTSDFQWSGSTVDSRDANSFLQFRLFDYANTSSMKMAQANAVEGNTGGTTFNVRFSNMVANITSAINRIDISTDGVGYNFTGGTYVLYGVK